MKTFTNLLAFPAVLLLCLVGLTAALAGWHRLDHWCERQLSPHSGPTITGAEHRKHRLGPWIIDTLGIVLLILAAIFFLIAL